MPSKRDESGIFRSIVHPTNPEARRYLENTVLYKYYKYRKELAAEKGVGGERADNAK
jgi:DNA-binding cell septation regulator SpoVG